MTAKDQQIRSANREVVAKETAMKSLRPVALLATLVGVALIATPAAAAQKYLLTGKFARSNGPVLDIPIIGNNPGGVRNCGHTTAMGKIPGMTPIYQGTRVTETMTMVATKLSLVNKRFANPNGCLSIAGKVTATAAGAGKAFQLPSMAFSRPFPGKTLAIDAPFPSLVQLATSFKVTGPPMNVGTGTSLGVPTGPPGGTMNNGMNTAMFRYFHKSAWLSQTGRAGAKFTWCFGNPQCTMVSQAKGYPNTVVDPVHQVFVKYTPGPNRFGGTMSHVITAGPNPSSVALSAGGAVQFLNLIGMGEQVTGRGYADYHVDAVMGGMAYAMFEVGPVYIPQLMSFQSLITSVMTPVPGTITGVTAFKDKNLGFPFTTGTVLARNTGTDVQKNPKVTTLTAMGSDVVTAMGARNISLVAGLVTGVDELASETPSLNQMFLPEAGSPAQLIAAVIALLAIAVRRACRPASKEC